jgi:hypothetical protein
MGRREFADDLDDARPLHPCDQMPGDATAVLLARLPLPFLPSSHALKGRSVLTEAEGKLMEQIVGRFGDVDLAAVHARFLA